jgi:glutathione S-transferase
MPEPVTIATWDWVPAGPRGHVRDIRLRWALEEAGVGYDVLSVRFADRGPEHLARQPFAQVPFLEHGEIRLFESGACLLYLAEQFEALMPRDAAGRADTLQWLFAALNSVEMVTVPWWFINRSQKTDNPLAKWMGQRFDRLEAVLAGRDWLGARFTVADIAMVDVLRVPDKLGVLEGHPVLRDYVARGCARPGFLKALADQMAHFAAADAARAAAAG